MLLPEYTVKQKLVYQPENSREELIIEPGMFIRPIWNVQHVPSHYLEILERANVPKSAPWGETIRLEETTHIMCIFGRLWVPIPANNIRVK